MICVEFGSEVSSPSGPALRMSLLSSSGMILLRGSSRPMRPLSMHWRSAMLAINFVVLASLMTASSLSEEAFAAIES